MKYYIFLTEEEAKAKDLEIYQSLNLNPIGVNAKTGLPEPDAQQTTNWATPMQLADGRWYIPSPDENGEEIPDELFIKSDYELR